MEEYKRVIKEYLEDRAENDELFAKTYAKPNKSLDECFKYILQEAKKRGNAVCMTDAEVFGLAVHYYDEDDIKVGSKPIAVKCGTSQAAPSSKSTKPSETKKKESKPKASKPVENKHEQMSIFDML